MKVLKFGGSSLRDASRIQSAAGIVAQQFSKGPLVAVVSALGGVTDELASISQLCAQGKPHSLKSLQSRHLEVIESLADRSQTSQLCNQAQGMLQELGRLLQGVSLLCECTPRTQDLILSYGERLSSLCLTTALRAAGLPAQACDARDMIVTNETFGAAQVDLEESFKRIRRHFSSQPESLQVVTGFIGATARGETTTLGRGGSDYSAALIGAALNVQAVEIWTDVDGVMSANPLLVPDAFPLNFLSYDELMELSHFGAKVVYPPTVHPARTRSIPLLIKNTLNPAFSGTKISNQAPPGQQDLIRGISSVERIALLRLEGDGMVGVPGICGRLFSAIAAEGINVILITQASSEHSICWAVAPESVTRARARVHREFDLERRAGLINDLLVEDDLCIVAAVGEGMRERPGIAGRIFKVLGDEGINVRAIAQGSSELNISLVLKRDDERKALNAIHRAFFRTTA